MQSVIEVLKTGNGKERLAVISDVVSIFGVSLATVVGGTYALATSSKFENIVGSLILTLLSIASFLVVTAVFVVCANWINSRSGIPAQIKKLLSYSIWICYIALFIYSVSWGFLILTHLLR